MRLGTQGTDFEGETAGANVVAGHEDNAVTDGAVGATIGGGGSTGSQSIGDTSRPNSNEVSARYSTIGGGRNNRVSGFFSTVGGGEGNTASDPGTTVGGGVDNTASRFDATVGGGLRNTASGFETTVCGGFENSADGRRATVAGGESNTADGDYSFAAGRAAKARHRGAFVWGDSTEGTFESTGPNQFLVVAAGGMGVGTARPRAQLHVISSEDGDADPEDHVAVIENRTAGSADVLALKMANRTPIGTGNNFVTFLDGTETGVGAIKGGGSGGGITLNTSSADYAEYLPRADPDESIAPGAVVGVVGGAVTKRTAETDQALVVSDRPTVAGNSPGPDPADRTEHEVCAFVGQVPVNVRGSVEAGDVVVPSGDEDGTGRAVAPDEYTPGDGPVVGRAWEGSPTTTEGVHEVTVVVGLETGGALHGIVAAHRDSIDAASEENGALRTETETLRAENAAFRERLATVEERLSALEGGRTPSAPADD